MKKKKYLLFVAFLSLIGCSNQLVKGDRTLELPTMKYAHGKGSPIVQYQLDEDRAWLRINNREYTCKLKER